ncbi:MAG: BrnT family toxin, partial [Nitrospirae bacterium]|nr:BrnT family toxin [Nitrospirota bacterium]
MTFEWDAGKADRNFKKHKVTFTEAATVFGDTLSITTFDPDHSIAEERYIIIGHSRKGRLLIVAHTERGDIIRIISARELTKSER